MDFLPFSGHNAPLLPAKQGLAARYDAAMTTNHNRKHWRNADYLSVNASNLPLIRRDLRSRARYEIANNSYAKGIVLTLANDTVGQGPALQMLTPDVAANKFIENEFEKWGAQIGLAEKLRTMRMAKAGDGEAFAMMIEDQSLRSPVTLNLRLYEADQVSAFGAPVWSMTDGIFLDDNGNPIIYTLLRQHPGDLGALWFQSEPIPAAAMIHYFRPDRPGQVRGIPEITAALPLFAMLRDYSLATLDAAKAAAYFAAVLYTDAPPDGTADTSVQSMDSIELERNMATTLPQGWKIGQVRAEHPTNTYKEFKHEILNEIARCLNMPFNIAACNSSGYNYSSGRMDHQTYFKSIKVEQGDMEAKILDRILGAWLYEASRIDGYLPQSARRLSFVPTHQWFWPGSEHVDPQKEAEAQSIRLNSLTTSLAHEYAKAGLDWEKQLEQIAKERKKMAALSIEMAPTTPKGTPVKNPEEAGVAND